MVDVPAIVYLLDIFRRSSDVIETFLELSPAEQAYIVAVVTSVLVWLWKKLKS